MPIAGNHNRAGSGADSIECADHSTGNHETPLEWMNPSDRRRYILSEFAEKCHLHGVYEIYHASNFRRALWILAFSIATGVAIYECVNIVMGFRESPVVVSYVIQEARTLPLPDIVICPFNRFDSVFVEEYNISTALQQYIETAFNDPGYFRHLYGLDPNRTDYLNNTVDKEDEFQELLARLELTTEELFERASIPCEAILPVCINARGPSCCDYAEGLMSSAGKCYRVPGSLQIGNGFGFGLKMVVSLPYSRFTPSLSNTHNDGFAVKLVERKGGLDFDLTYIPIGVHALMPLRATKYEFLNNPPKFTCAEDRKENYSRVTCFDNCYHARGESACGCSRAGSLHPRYPVCTPKQMRDCFWAAYANITIDLIEQFIFDCRQECLPNCTYWQFTTSVSYAKFPAPTLQKFGNLSQWKNTSIIDIYYENLAYTVIKHHPSMTFETFVANIGGQIGLWVGGSILTTLQVMVFIVQLIYSLCRRNQQDSSSISSNAVTRPDPYDTYQAENGGNPMQDCCHGPLQHIGRSFHTETPGDSNKPAPVAPYKNGTCPTFEFPPFRGENDSSRVLVLPQRNNVPFSNFQHEEIV